MALVHLTFTHDALPASKREALARELGRLVYSAEGFGSSRLAPQLTRTIVDEMPRSAFATVSDGDDRPLYHIVVTTLAGALTMATKQALGSQIAQMLMETEGSTQTPDNLARAWVQFVDVLDGDLVVGGESTSLAGLKLLVAQAG